MAALKRAPTFLLSTTEQDLRTMWEEAERDFSRLTRKTLRTDHEKRLEDVIAEFERKYEPPSFNTSKQSGDAKKSKIKGTIIKVLQCVQLLGGLAAQGASIVFGPATLCFNAISFLLDVPGRIAAVYEGIESLFDEVSHFLVLMKLSEKYDSLDPALRDGTHKLMMCVVRICALSIKIIDGGVAHYVKIGMKITFLNDDSDVRTELANIKDLIDKHSRVTSAVTLQHVLENKKDIAEVLKNAYLNTEQLSSMNAKLDSLVADVGDRRIQTIIDERVKHIAKMLSTNEELVQEAKQAMLNLKNGLLPQSSQWLLNDDDYKEWKAASSDRIPLLLLSGGPKTGKSHLLAVIDEDFRSMSNNVAILYHAFSERDTKSTKDRNRDEVGSALKSMALQLASQHPPYAKDMIAIKDFSPPDGRTDNPIQWWNKLLFPKHSQSREDVSIIFMFDGLNTLTKDELSGIVGLLKNIRKSLANHQKMRIVATGNQEAATESFPFIQVTDHNTADIKAYIEHELDRDTILSGHDVEMLELLQSIRATLPDKANGSFAVVQQKLERIREAIEDTAYLDDVEKILLEDPTDDHDKLAQKALSDLNTTLQAQEIELLNELLTWVVFGFEYFTIKNLRAAMFLKSGRSPLQPLEKMLEKKYSKILFRTDDIVEVNRDIQALFESDEPTVKRSIAPDGDGAMISMQITIAQADLRTVQRFFWDLTDKVGISRFDFLGATRSDESKGFVQCEEHRAHYHIATQLLNLLNDEPHEKTKDLIRYALQYLPSHLKKVKAALDAGGLGLTERKTIAERLVDLLSDVEGIEKHWNVDFNTYSDWIDDESGVKTIGAWLTDSETVKVLEPREKRWVKQYTAAAEGKAGFYKPITLMLARRWLQDREWNHHDTYKWISAFSKLQSSDRGKDNKMAGNTNNSEKRGSEDDIFSSEDPPKTPTDIVLAKNWAQRALNLRDKDLNSLWFERIGEACHQAEKYETARAWYEMARALPNSSWSVEVRWATVEALLCKQRKSNGEQKNARESACKAMDSALVRLRTDWQERKDKMNVQERESCIASLKELARWQGELQATDRAIEIYSEALSADSGSSSTYVELLRLFNRLKMHKDARKLLLQILRPSGESKSFDLFIPLFQDLTSDETNDENLSIINFIMVLTQSDSTLTEQMLEAMYITMQNAKIIGLDKNEGILLLYQGILLARSATGDTQLQQAVKSWEDCQSLYTVSKWDLARTKDLATRYIAQHHFNKAMKHGLGVESNEHVNRLLKLSRAVPGWYRGFKLRSYLASYYAKQGRFEDARKVFRNDMIDALGILTDGDADNDAYGYKYLADAFMHTGDSLNALSAWSMLTPAVCQGYWGYRCDGRCGVSWPYPSDLYVCRYCPDTQFTADCLKKLRDGRLERYVCHPKHSWLYVPARNEAHERTVDQDKVRVHGYLLDNGERIASDVVSKDDWFREIRERWGISEDKRVARDV